MVIHIFKGGFCTKKSIVGGITGIILGMIMAGYFLIWNGCIWDVVLSPIVFITTAIGLITGLINNTMKKLYAHILWGIAIGLVGYSFLFLPANMLSVGFITSLVVGSTLGLATYLSIRH